MACVVKRVRCVLTIAGSDSGAGAGVQADARTIHALGGFALTAITAVTAQNTRGVRAWLPVRPELLRAQIEAVMGDFDVAAIKTGLLPGGRAIETVARALAAYPKVPLIVDPVIGSTSGTRFLADGALKTLGSALLVRATIVTPNWPEAAALSGRRVTTVAEAEAAGREMAERFRCAVLVKGGHAPGGTCPDCFVPAAGRVRWFESPRVATKNTHGTGCVLSAAIATELARGKTLPSAVGVARRFLHRQLESGRAHDWGGTGPAFAGVRRPR